MKKFLILQLALITLLQSTSASFATSIVPICATCEPIKTITKETKSVSEDDDTETKKTSTTSSYRYYPTAVIKEDFSLPNLSEEQKQLEAKGINPYKTTKNSSKKNIDKSKDYLKKQFKELLEKKLKEEESFEIFDEDGELLTVNKDSKVNVATSAEQSKKYILKNELYFGPNSDSDNDGIGDFIEIMIYNTNPLEKDSDKDGFTDNEEITAFNTNPLEESSIVRFPRITNLNNSIVGENPMIKGVGPIGETIRIAAKNIQTGEVFEVCEAETDTNGNFACMASRVKSMPVPDGNMPVPDGNMPVPDGNMPVPDGNMPVPDGNHPSPEYHLGENPDAAFLGGDYYLYPQNPLEEGETQRSVVRISVNDKTENLGPGAVLEEAISLRKGTKIAHTQQWMRTFLGDNQYESLMQERVEAVTEEDFTKKVFGETVPGSVVMAVWKSEIQSSMIISDPETGKFSLLIPEDLEVGAHNVFLQTFNPKTGTISNVTKVSFEK